ncbi:glycosyltransferase family 4 protein [uncultured Nitrosomonas sp.]|uniref:glycosyltransferase family 4 protein n=1 Tax=uncultured Nitrosomonas sp. TaxID=156424 RepID=UPI0025EE8990|nr:glycosyltransferase family 4 protein [uncultured Nitrosomonas sp.]
MNIVILTNSMSSGGAERVTANLANEWAKCGWQVTVITLAPKSMDFYELSSDISRIALDLSGESSSILKAILSNLHRVIAIRRELRRLSPDIVLAVMTTSSVLAILAGIRLGIPVIATEHNYPPMKPANLFWDRIRKWTYPYAARVVMLTSEGLDWLNNKIPRARGVVIPNPSSYPLAISEPFLAPAAWIASERRLLLAVGRLDEQKGFDYLLMAFSELVAAHQDWDLVVLGEGLLREALELQMQTHALETRVHLPGRVGNVSDWYQRADLYVMSSRYEGFPMTLVEVMAHGCAAVSYDCDTGPRDIIRHGVDGLLVSPVGDVPALASALDQLMRNDEARERMGQRAIEIRERYSPESILTMWNKLFNEEVSSQVIKC